MHKIYIDQKLLSVRERFTVRDESENPIYKVEGSLFKIPKSFAIFDMNRHQRAKVWKKPLSFLPKFYLEIDGVQVAEIKKEFTFFKPRYQINGPGIEVKGNIWDMTFDLFKNAQHIGRVDKKWWSVRDKYAIEIDQKEDEILVLAIVLSIDYVKKMEAAAASSSAASS
jgi:uncharacterized protein YxjI